MLKIGEDKSISVTRGDSVVFGVSQKSKYGTLRVFNVGDVVRFTVVKKKDYSSVVLQKDFAVVESCEVVNIALTSQETRIGESINKETEYWYEVEVNPGTSDTIIGHDVSGAKQFWLYPEAKVIEEPEIKPEDIPVVDDKLDVTSERPVENRVVAKAILLLEEENENLSQKVNKMDEQLGILASRVKNLTTLKEGSTTADAELIDIRAGADGTVYESARESVIKQIEKAVGGVTVEFSQKIDTASQKAQNAVKTAEEVKGVAEKNARDLMDLQDLLGIHYNDEDIIGLEVDFENSTYTRLGAAVGLEAGENFNRFPVYRDRVRCNVADDGTINTICGSGEIVPLCDFQEVEFGEGAPPCPPYDETGETGGSNGIELTTTPHPTDAGSNIKIYVNNVTTGKSYVLNGILGDPYAKMYENQIFGTFKTSDGANCILTGWAKTNEGSGHYENVFQFFTYPNTTDTLKIKVELERSEYRDDGSNGQVMVYQPKFYYRVVPTKLEKNEGGLGYHIRKANYYISSKPKPFFKLHPAFYDENGKAVEYILYSAYESSMYDVSTGEYVNDGINTDTAIGEDDTLCSVAGVKPISGLKKPLTKTNLEMMAQNRGSSWHLETIKAISANQLLMMIELGEMNTQTAIGRGIVYISDNTSYNCASITGSTAYLGNATGMAEQTVSEIGGVETVYTENGKVAVSYRGIENPWGNMWKHVQGINIWGDGTMGGGQPYVANAFTFDENKHNEEGYEPVGFTLANTNGYIKAMGYGNEKFDWLLMPSEVGGTSALPVGDQLYAAANLNGYRIALLGGNWLYSDVAGSYCFGCSDSVGLYGRGTNGRLMYVPTAK